jgi:hypothetical protein
MSDDRITLRVLTWSDVSYKIGEVESQLLGQGALVLSANAERIEIV